VDNLPSVPGNKIFLVQLADAYPLGMSDLLQYSRHYRVFPGQGGMPLIKFLRALQSTGYNGPYSLEVFNDGFKAACPVELALDGFRSLVYLYKSLDPDLAMVMPVVRGIEFVEFWCTTSEFNDLHEFICDYLGFRNIGKHKSRPLYLYRHGQCHFVINCESEIHAPAFHFSPGVLVRSIGILVNDVDCTVAWAQDLKYTVISQKECGIGEERVLAVRAPDNNLIYLLNPAAPDAFLSDFVFTPTPSFSDGTLTVDYISRVLHPRDLDKTILFYRALFGLELREKSDIIDPKGLVHSYVMTSKSGDILMCLNVTSEDATVVGKFLSHCGPGIHQISLRTDDIFSIMPKMGKNFLRLPQNYFDDLETRFGLSSEELTALNQQNVMYDVDQNGEFLHACTDAYRDSFFIEFVERRGQYNGYGVQNVSFRTVMSFV
jgi:4-hydroxyphenylpyruvate dioxygenase